MKEFFGTHKKCSTNKCSKYAKGSVLELLQGFKSGPNFKREGTYKVCEFIQRKIIQMKLRSDITVADSCFELLEMPDEDKNTRPSLPNLLKIRVDGCRTSDFPDLSLKDKRLTNDEKQLEDIKEAGRSFKIDFSTLVARQQQRRSCTLANSVIAACITKEELKSQGLDCIKQNEKLAEHVISLLDIVKGRIEKLIGINFESLENGFLQPPPSDEISEDDLMTCFDI